MAKDELLEEPLFREIDEDLRRDQWQRLWKRYQWLVISAIAGILLAVAGTQIWQHYRQEDLAKASLQFANASALSAKDPAAAIAAFQSLAGNGPKGYALLARLQAAALMAGQGDRAGALAIFRQLETEAPEPAYRDLATLLDVLVSLQAPASEINADEINARLLRLAGDANPWRFSARELQAQMAFAAGNKPEAERLANALIADQATPAGIRSRARMLLTQTGQS